jgi:hypothetical protein
LLPAPLLVGLALAAGPTSEPANDTYSEPVSIVSLSNTPDMFMDARPDMFMDRAEKSTVA